MKLMILFAPTPPSKLSSTPLSNPTHSSHRDHHPQNHKDHHPQRTPDNNKSPFSASSVPEDPRLILEHATHKITPEFPTRHLRFALQRRIKNHPPSPLHHQLQTIPHHQHSGPVPFPSPASQQRNLSTYKEKDTDSRLQRLPQETLTITPKEVSTFAKRNSCHPLALQICSCSVRTQDQKTQ